MPASRAPAAMRAVIGLLALRSIVTSGRGTDRRIACNRVWIAAQPDHFRSDRNATIKMGDIGIAHADASARDLRADGGRIVGAVNTMVGVAEIKCARAKWIARATTDPARQVRLTGNLFRLAESRRAILICAISASVYLGYDWPATQRSAGNVSQLRRGDRTESPVAADRNPVPQCLEGRRRLGVYGTLERQPVAFQGAIDRHRRSETREASAWKGRKVDKARNQQAPKQGGDTHD